MAEPVLVAEQSRLPGILCFRSNQTADLWHTAQTKAKSFSRSRPAFAGVWDRRSHTYLTANSTSHSWAVPEPSATAVHRRRLHPHLPPRLDLALHKMQVVEPAVPMFRQ